MSAFPLRSNLVMFFFCLLAATGPAWCDDAAGLTGPVIKDFGPVMAVEPQFNLLPEGHYRVVFDVAQSAEDPAAMNRSIESAARFLNMHARAGIDPANLEVAVVLHGGAGKDALANTAYHSRYGIENPNSSLLLALKSAGVQIWLCGQTAAYRGFGADELHPSAGLALSAMTVLTRLQTEGWALLPW